MALAVLRRVLRHHRRAHALRAARRAALAVEAAQLRAATELLAHGAVRALLARAQRRCGRVH